MATENQNGTGATEQPVDVVAPATAGAEETPVADPKGKGKAVATEPVQEDTAMDEDDDDEEDDEDEAAEDAEDDDEEAAEGEAISLDNVVNTRTRGKVIDFAKAAEENPAEEEDDEDDDGDFEDEEMDED